MILVNIMFDKFKNILKKEEEKSVVICIHGFGRRKQHEFDNFKLWDKDNELITFDIYDLESQTDNDAEVWILRCEDKVESYLANGYKVSLIGFSMGGVIASHLAAKYNVDKLFLISPAFDYFHTGHLYSLAKDAIKKEEPKEDDIKIPTSYATTFMEVVKRIKDDIENVTCPVCFVHGSADEVIPVRSSINAYEKIKHNNKKLFIIYEGKHRMMLHQNSCYETYLIYKNFMDGNILGNKKIEYAPDILNEEKYKE